jgi:hypothetical protein
MKSMIMIAIKIVLGAEAGVKTVKGVMSLGAGQGVDLPMAQLVSDLDREVSHLTVCKSNEILARDAGYYYVWPQKHVLSNTGSTRQCPHLFKYTSLGL